MTSAPRVVVQLLCLLSYLWVSTGVASLLQVHWASTQQPNARIIVDESTHSLIVHYQGHRDQHEPKADSTLTTDDDHVVKMACVHPDFSALSSHIALAKTAAVDVLFAYLPPPVVSHTALAQVMLVAQQPPPALSPPISRNSSIAIVQLTRLRI